MTQIIKAKENKAMASLGISFNFKLANFLNMLF